MAASTYQLLAAVLPLALVIGPLLRLVGAHDVGVAVGWMVLQTVPGAAVLLLVGRVARVAFAVYATALSAAIATIPATAMAMGRFWHPDALHFVEAATSTAISIVSLIRGPKSLPPISPRGALRWSSQVGVVLVSALGLLIAGAAAATHQTDPQRGGLTAVVGPWWFVGLVLILAGFLWAVTARVIVAAPVLAAAVVVVLSQALVYRTPNVLAAARHVGVIDYILVHHRLDRGLDIYQAWSGFFAEQAFLIHASGMQDRYTAATWWPVYGSVASVLAVRLLAGRFITPERAWAAAGLFALGNALNIVYFSPQAFAFVLGITIVSLLICSPADATRTVSAMRVVVVISLAATIAISHQITPYMIVSALVAMLLLRIIGSWWALLAVLLPAVAWALFNRAVASSYINPSTIGDVFANFSPPDHPPTAFGTPTIATLTFDIPALVLVLIAAAGLVTLLRRRTRMAWALTLAALSACALVVGPSYGQESVFRVALFALPWLSILALRPHLKDVALLQAPAPMRRWLSTATVGAGACGVLAAALLAVNVLGQTGMDWARIMRQGTIQVETYYERTAPAGSVMFEVGTKNATPDRSTARYLQLGWTSRDELAAPGQPAYPLTTGRAYNPESDIAAFTKTFLATPATKHYALMSVDIGAYDERYGDQYFSDYLRLKDAMLTSSQWKLVTKSSTAWLFEAANGQ